MLVHAACIGAMFKQRPGNRWRTYYGCRKRRQSRFALGVYLGARGNQSASSFEASIRGSSDQGCNTSLVGRVWVGSSREQRLDHLGMTFDRGSEQGTHATVRSLLMTGAVLEQQSDRARIPLRRRHNEDCGIVLVACLE